MSNHVMESLRMSREAQSVGENETLRNENYRLKQEVKELKKQLLLAACGINHALYIDGRKND